MDSEKIKYNDIPKTVYHYCSLENFMKIMESSSIRLSNITKSNDLQEIIYILPELSQALVDISTACDKKIYNEDYKLNIDIYKANDIIEKYFSEISKNFYVACFSEKRDSLNQWARYADDGKGIAIGFNAKQFAELQVESSGYVFGKVHYEEKYIISKMKESIFNYISKKWCDNDCENNSIVINAIQRYMSTMLYNSVLFKHPSFEEESEWRLSYAPFGRIRRVNDMYLFWDRMNDVNNSANNHGFIRNKVNFKTNQFGITSYIDLDFSNYKTSLINEIVIGPTQRMDINDKDLSLFLHQCGYFIPNTLNNSLRIYKSICPYYSK